MSMSNVDELIASVDWSRLTHMHGRASDTPAHLAGLFSTDPTTRERAIHHLDNALLHQDTPGPAAGPAARIVAELLPMSDAEMRPVLMGFLGDVAAAGGLTSMSDHDLRLMATLSADREHLLHTLLAEDDELVFEEEDLVDALFSRAVLGCRESAPYSLQSVLAFVADRNPHIRLAAEEAAVRINAAGTAYGSA